MVRAIIGRIRLQQLSKEIQCYFIRISEKELLAQPYKHFVILDAVNQILIVLCLQLGGIPAQISHMILQHIEMGSKDHREY